MEAGATDLVVANPKHDPVEAVMEITDGNGADSVFETVGGSAPMMSQAIDMSRNGGAISVLGLFSEPVEINAAIARWKECESSGRTATRLGMDSRRIERP
jgi:threonine dehydrogenase-like Zn-dependent dehydrogenase